MKTTARGIRLTRGQSLVLMGLNMLLMTILVCMTLSFGQKAKEKMELQMMADQAAYSTSVATARAFNQLAVMNRTIVAHNVVQIGVDASISFTSLWYGILSWLLLDYTVELIANQIPQCDPPWQWCGCFGIFGVFFGRWLPIWFRGWALYSMYPGLDMAAAQQANSAALNALVQWTFQLGLMGQLYLSHLNSQNTARNSVNIGAAGQPEISVPGGGDAVTKKEVGIIPFTGAINLTNIILSDRHAVAAAMGSRTHPYTAGRWGFYDAFTPSGTALVLTQFFDTLTQGDVDFFISDGTSYFSKGILHGNWLLAPSASTMAVSDDHLGFFEQYQGIGCSGLPLGGLAFSYMAGSDAIGQHEASGLGLIIGFPDARLFVVDLPPVWFLHDFNHFVPSICILNCPSAWSNFVDYDDLKLLPVLGGGEPDNWGQPKAPVTVQRDYGSRPGSADPWDLAFNLRWHGRNTDLKMKQNYGYGGNNGIQLNPMTSGCSGTDCDISKQTALSTGITYYHRGGGHFKEPPNLFNPWWKAGLTHSDADDASANGNDIPNTLNNSGAGWAVDSYNQLKWQGYRGWQ